MPVAPEFLGDIGSDTNIEPLIQFNERLEIGPGSLRQSGLSS